MVSGGSTTAQVVKICHEWDRGTIRTMFFTSFSAIR
jgi:hypothetical protein